MTGQEVAQIILNTATLVTAVGAVIIGLRNGQKSEANSVKIDRVHDIANSLSDKRVEEAKTASFAAGELHSADAAKTVEAARLASFDAGAKAEKDKTISPPHTDTIP